MSDDEDYMSNDLLEKIDDVKPGIATNRYAQRLLKINSNREAAEKRKRVEKPMTKEQMERSRFDEGVNKPIGSETKGFKLLSMMGYKPGMSLGRAREGQISIKEPIQIEIKPNRTGIGHEKHRDEKHKELCEAHMEQMRKRARLEEVLADDFRSRKRFLALKKQTISDIQNIRKACQELDIRSGKEGPEEYWFWPIYSSDNNVEEADTVDANKLKRQRLERSNEKGQHCGETSEEVIFLYHNGRLAPVDINFSEYEEHELCKSLYEIISYMRMFHFYCHWCGHSFESEEDMKYNCPGLSRNDHEE